MIRPTALAIAVLALSALAFRGPGAGATEHPTVSVNSAEAAAGSTVAVTVHGDSGASTVGAFTVDLAYDPAVLSATDCLSTVGLCRTGVTPATTRVAGASLGGISGPFQFMTVTFDVIGPPGSVSPLDVQVIELSDMQYQDLIPQTEVTDGQVSVPAAAQVKGDADCDGDVTSLDALAVLRDVAGKEAAPCPGPADTDCDGEITSLDSLAILRYVASLPASTPGGCTPIGQPA
jgi:hypothetical protein